MGLALGGLEEGDAPAVRDAFRVHAVQEAQVIDMLVDVREEIRGPATGFAMLLEVPQRLHHALERAFAGLGHGTGIGHVDDLAVVFEESRLVVVGIDVADAALHEEEDDAFRLRLMVRTFDSEGICQCGLTLCHRLPGKIAEATAGGLEEIASGGRHVGSTLAKRRFLQ